MRFRNLMIFMTTLLLVAVLAAARSGRSTLPPATAPVRVLLTEPVRVVLSPAPSVTEISSELKAAIQERADGEYDPTMRRYMEALSTSDDYLERISRGARERLGSDAGALAYQLIHVDVSAERIAIAAITAELLPNRGYIGTSTAHEDGHALINDQVALRCGPAIARSELAVAKGVPQLRTAILDALYAAGDRAHEVYHGEVNATRRDFDGAARRAVQATAGSSCTTPAP
jgi:hypothetical protein